MMVVLNSAQKAYLDKVLVEQRNLYPVFCAVEPVAIKNNLWIIPAACLEDPNYAVFAKWLGEDLNGLVVREIEPEELIEPIQLFTIEENG
jgi:hypothetical protein